MAATAKAPHRAQLPRYASVAELIAERRPTAPVYALFPDKFQKLARTFIEGFPGETLYAVKANHALPVLDQLYAAGIRHFDIASVAEARLIHERFPAAKQSFMSPVKLFGATGEAYKLGVRRFALDTEEELDKILRETGAAKDPRIARELTLFVRLTARVEGALLELSSKFGGTPAEAADLMRNIADAGAKPALTFHVGSQCLDPQAFVAALALCQEAIDRSGVDIFGLDVGGGFPGHEYLNVDVPPAHKYFTAIKAAIAAMKLPSTCAVCCEPGRALVADGMSVITQVSLRYEDMLYLNDGIYGSLNEYALKNWPVRYPLRVFTTAPDGAIVEKTGPIVPYRAFGPTCDSLDVLPAPLDLPVNVASGDWVEFQKMGAYSCALRTAFNGFYPDTFVEIG